MNGAGGRCVYGRSLTSATRYSVSATAVATAVARSSPSWTTLPRVVSWPVSASKSRPVATRAPSSSTSLAGNASGGALSSSLRTRDRTSQNDALTKRMRSRSRSTISRMATDWTRPAESRGRTFFHSTGETS